MPRDSDYEVLGLRPGASLDEAKQAHRDLVKVWHPDRFSNDPRLQARAQEKLQEINAANDRVRVVLSSPGTRSQPSSSPPPRPPSSPPPPPRPAAPPPPRPPQSPSQAGIPRKNGGLVVVGLALVLVLGSVIWRHAYQEDSSDTHESPIPLRPPQSDTTSLAHPAPPSSPPTGGPSAPSTPRVETPWKRFHQARGHAWKSRPLMLPLRRRTTAPHLNGSWASTSASWHDAPSKWSCGGTCTSVVY